MFDDVAQAMAEEDEQVNNEKGDEDDKDGGVKDEDKDEELAASLGPIRSTLLKVCLHSMVLIPRSEANEQ